MKKRKIAREESFTFFRIIAIYISIMIAAGNILPASAQETAEDPAIPFVLEQITQEEFDGELVKIQMSEQTDESVPQEGTKDEENAEEAQTDTHYIYENNVLEIGSGYWKISTKEPASSRIVVSGDAGLILADADVIAMDGAALTAAPGTAVQIILAKGSVNHLMGAAGYPAVSAETGEGTSESAGVTVLGCGLLTLEGGSGAEAVQGTLTDQTFADPDEAEADSEQAGRITIVDSAEVSSPSPEAAGDPEQEPMQEDPWQEPAAEETEEEAIFDEPVEEVLTEPAAAQEDAVQPGPETDGAAQEPVQAEDTAQTKEPVQAEVPAQQDQNVQETAEGSEIPAQEEDVLLPPSDPETHTEITAKEVSEPGQQGAPEADKAQKTGKSESGSASSDTGEKAASDAEKEQDQEDSPQYMDISVEIKWEDEQDRDALRPSLVTVYLYANGEETGRSVVLHGENEWEAVFEQLPAKKDGKSIAYSVVEEPFDGYSASIEGDAQDGYTITNAHSLNPTGRSAQDEIRRIRAGSDKQKVKDAPSVTTVTTGKVSRTATNYSSAQARTSTTVTRTRSPKTADAAQPAQWGVPLLLGVAGLYIWMRREQK